MNGSISDIEISTSKEFKKGCVNILINEYTNFVDYEKSLFYFFGIILDDYFSGIIHKKEKDFEESYREFLKQKELEGNLNTFLEKIREIKKINFITLDETSPRQNAMINTILEFVSRNI